ncbi:hypothetical protein KAH55_13400, partial [bacterium]|nr:hypothetical protein [bacterium]
QFWPDLVAGIAEIQRVLKPGGTAFVGRGFPASMPENVARQVREKQHGGPQYSISGTKARFENMMHEMNLTNYTILVPHPELKDVSYGIWLKFKKVR